MHVENKWENGYWIRMFSTLQSVDMYSQHIMTFMSHLIGGLIHMCCTYTKNQQNVTHNNNICKHMVEILQCLRTHRIITKLSITCEAYISST